MSTNEVIQAEYVKAAADGLTIVELASKLDMKVDSLNGRVTRLRNELRAAGSTPSEIAIAFPKLKRVVGGGRSRKVSAFASSLVAKIRASQSDVQSETSETTEKENQPV